MDLFKWDTTCFGKDPKTLTTLPGDVATINCLPYLFSSVVNAALMLGGTVALLMIIYGGLRMILSGGDAKQAGAARSIITYAIVGLVIVFLSFFILNFITYITGVTCIDNFNIRSCTQGGQNSPVDGNV